MVVVVGLLIVTAVLTLSAVVVLFALASEAELLPALTRDASSGSDEPAADPGERRGAAGISPQSRSRVSLSN
jgi:hypothetical protein